MPTAVAEPNAWSTCSLTFRFRASAKYWDEDHLASVEAGAVLGEIGNSGPPRSFRRVQ